MTLEALAWNAQWQQKFEAVVRRSDASLRLQPGRIIAEHRTHYQIGTDTGELSAEATGRFRMGR